MVQTPAPNRGDRSSPNSPPNPSRSSRQADIRPAARVEWWTFRNWFAGPDGWQQDEHISVIGTTGTGKSALIVDLLGIRSYTVYVITKPADDKLQRALLRRGYLQVPAFPNNPPEDVDRYLLWPPGGGTLEKAGQARQKIVLHDALNKMFEGPKQGGEPGRWCVCLDEARYVADPKYLGLASDVNLILIQGRSIFMSMVLLFQRPAWVPPEAYDQVSHLFIAKDNDKRNVLRFREIGGVDGDEVRATVESLEKYEWCYVDARPGGTGCSVIKMPKGL